MDDLCNLVTAYLCQPGITICTEKCPVGTQVFSKGCTQAICTVKLEHGQLYNIEFVYKFWQHKLADSRFPVSPCFIITNNGLATTLKCYINEPRELRCGQGQGLAMDCDVNLGKNMSVIMKEDDFTKFKTRHVFTKDLAIFNSMVVCRTYLTETRQALQFLVVKPRSLKKVSSILDSITFDMDETCGLQSSLVNIHRRPIREAEKVELHAAPSTEFLQTLNKSQVCKSLWTKLSLLTVIIGILLICLILYVLKQ